MDFMQKLLDTICDGRGKTHIFVHTICFGQILLDQNSEKKP